MNKNQSMDNFTHGAGKALKGVAEDLAPQAQRLGSRLNDTLATAASGIADAGANAAETLKSAAASTDEFVRDNPWIAIGVAAGIAGAVGFLAGLMAAPKKRFWT